MWMLRLMNWIKGIAVAKSKSGLLGGVIDLGCIPTYF